MHSSCAREVVLVGWFRRIVLGRGYIICWFLFLLLWESFPDTARGISLMERLTNPFTALSLAEDDEDVIAAVNIKGKSSSKTSRDDSFQENRSKRIGAETQSLYKPLVWIDLEMTGLNIEKDRILEIACIITDGKLEKVIEGPDLIIKQPESALAGMNAWCQEHHTASGLVEGVRRSTITEHEAEEQVLDFVNQYVPGKAHIAGNSVYVDLQFIQKYMPKLAKIFSHIVVDVSSVRALCIRWYPQDADKAPEKKNHHRALDDIKESIAELRAAPVGLEARSLKTMLCPSS